MADSASAVLPTQRRADDGSISVASSTALAMGGAGAIGFGTWVIDMIDRNDFTNPPVSVMAFIVACLTPFVHLIGRGIMRRLSKWAGDN